MANPPPAAAGGTLGADEPTQPLPPGFSPGRQPPVVPLSGRAGRLLAMPLALQLGAWLGAAGLLAATAALAWWLVAPQRARPYVYDEAAFAFAGRAVAATGRPLSNVGHLQTETPGDFSKRFNWALWHPPLYVYLLGFAFRKWGEQETTARTIGLICNAATAALIFAIAQLLLAQRTRAAPLYAAAGTAIYLLNPLVQQSALLIDIDGSVLVASIALLTFVYLLLLRSTRPLRHPRTLGLLAAGALCLALSLWAKMTTSLALVAAAGVYRLLATRPWRPWLAVIEPVAITAAGGGLFALTWWLAAVAGGMPFWFPFRILALEFAEARSSTSDWPRHPEILLQLVSNVALWVSPYLTAVVAWAGLARLCDLLLWPLDALRRRLRHQTPPEPWGLQPVDFVLACGAGIGAVYLIKLAGSFPKYHITMMPFWAIAAAYLLARFVPRLSWWEVPVYAVVLAGMAGYFTVFVGDRQVLFRGFEFIPPLLLWPAVLGAAYFVLSAAAGRTRLPRQLAILGLVLTLAWSWGVDLAQAQADYSTAYNYGIAGQKQAAAYLTTILRPGEPFVAAREVAYYTPDPLFVDQETWWAHIERLSAAGIPSFDGRLLGYRITTLALFLWDPTLGQIAHSYLDHDYAVAFQNGPFFVFVRTTPWS